MSRGDATDRGFRRALGILRSLYPFVQTLEEFSDALVFPDGRKPRLQDDGDSAGFTQLVREVVVCAFTPPQQQRVPAQMNTVTEVLAFTLNYLKRRRLRNVLVFGYSCGQLSESLDPFHFHGDISQNALGISTSRLWYRINQRLGSEVTRLLLQDCSVFVCVPPSCLLQVCGPPVYDLTPRGPGALSRTDPLQPGAMRKRAGEEGHPEAPAMKRQRVEPKAEEALISGGNSWKPAEYIPARLSGCSVRVMSLLYHGRGLKSFLLNRKLKTDGGGARLMQGADLVRLIFLDGTTSSRLRKLPRRFFAMEPLFSRLLRRHRKCPYRRLLSRTCSGALGAELLRVHCSPYRVYLFVRESLRSVVPDELWGSWENQLHFLSNVKHFLRLGKFDGVSLVQLMWRMREAECRWLGPRGRVCASEQRYRRGLLGRWLLWLMKGLVVGLVRSCFYVTETLGHKNALRFYRTHIWNRLHGLAFKMLLSKGQWSVVEPSKVNALMTGTITSRIRFIPKRSGGMRPISRLTGATHLLQHFQSCVRVLQDVLKVCVAGPGGVMGSTVWGWQDIQRVLRDFTPAHKFFKRPLYFVKVDVRGAYDSLPHDKLLEVLSEVFSGFLDETFYLRQFCRVGRDTTHCLKKRFCSRAHLFESMKMKDFMKDEQISGNLYSSVLVEQRSSEVRGHEVLQFFNKMLTSHIICQDKKVFRQMCGIPQGSSVSSLLCNLCYGHMEKVLFKDIAEDGCLMRLVDDFLLITPHLNKALDFLKTLLAGVPDYGCRINEEKVVVNFPVSVEMEGSGVKVFPLRCLFPWCGLMLDTYTLNVYKDYSRYDGLSLRYSLTLGSALSPAALMNKLLLVLNVNTTYLLLDLEINSVEAVYKNLYKMIFLQALRFHVCVKALPLGQSVSTNPCFFMRRIWTMARVANTLIKSANAGVGDAGGPLPVQAVQLLFCVAFESVCTRHRSSYRDLLPLLRRRCRQVRRELSNMQLARVRQAFTPTIPLEFKSIRM